MNDLEILYMLEDAGYDPTFENVRIIREENLELVLIREAERANLSRPDVSANYHRASTFNKKVPNSKKNSIFGSGASLTRYNPNRVSPKAASNINTNRFKDEEGGTLDSTPSSSNSRIIGSGTNLKRPNMPRQDQVKGSQRTNSLNGTSAQRDIQALVKPQQQQSKKTL